MLINKIKPLPVLDHFLIPSRLQYRFSHKRDRISHLYNHKFSVVSQMPCLNWILQLSPFIAVYGTSEKPDATCNRQGMCKYSYCLISISEQLKPNRLHVVYVFSFLQIMPVSCVNEFPHFTLEKWGSTLFSLGQKNLQVKKHK